MFNTYGHSTNVYYVLCVTEIKYEMVMCKCEHDPHTTDTIEIAWKNGSLVIFYRA